jgi:microcystin-dependent protein
MTKLRTQKDESLPRIPDDISPSMKSFLTDLTEKISGIFRNTRLDLDTVNDNLVVNLPAGIISMWGNATAPTGYVLCDGSSLLRAGTYADLYSAIGTTFGSVDGAHFNAPDFRGIFPKGAGTTTRAAGVCADGTTYFTAVLGAYYQDMMQSHWHTTYDNGNGTKRVFAVAANIGTDTTPLTGQGNVKEPSSDGTNGTPRTGKSTEPQSLGINFIIKY